MLKTGSKCSELERESYIEYTCSQWLQHAFIYASAEIGLGLWCSTLFSIIFQLYGAGKFYWWRKHEYTEKTNNLPQVTDNLITLCCIEYSSAWARFERITVVVIGTDCKCSCKSNYHTIMTMTVRSRDKVRE